MRPLQVILANAVLTLAGLTATVAHPAAGRPVAVVSLPWAPDGASLMAVAAAAGSIVSMSGGVVVATSGDPNFVSRLYRTGAVVVLDAGFLHACRSQQG